MATSMIAPVAPEGQQYVGSGEVLRDELERGDLDVAHPHVDEPDVPGLGDLLSRERDGHTGAIEQGPLERHAQTRGGAPALLELQLAQHVEALDEELAELVGRDVKIDHYASSAAWTRSTSSRSVILAFTR
jgi:hypothetical protein